MCSRLEQASARWSAHGGPCGFAVPEELLQLEQGSNTTRVLCWHRGAVLAMWAAQALLMALVLKLRVSRALDDAEAPPASGAYRVGPCHIDCLVLVCILPCRIITSMRCHWCRKTAAMGPVHIPHCSWCGSQAGSGMLEKQAAGFLGSCLPSNAMLGSTFGLKGAGGEAMHRLDAQGLGWAPTLGNLCTLLCFVLALALNAQLNEVGGPAG